MKAEQVIRDRLSTHAGVNALVAGRVHPVLLPQEPTFPAIAFQRVSSSRMRGVNADPGVATVTVRVTCADDDYAGVKALAEQVRLALERYGYAEAGTLIAGVTVYDIVIESDSDDFDADLNVYTVSMTFEVTHAE